MGTLSYTATMSIDGYVADADGDFQWSGPDDEVFGLHVERMGAVSTEVLGRNTYQLMRYWETGDDSWGGLEREFARRWRGLKLVVASSTLAPGDVVSDRVRLVADLSTDELAGIVRDAPGEVEIFGPTTAAAAIRAGMVTDFRVFVVPKIVGGGLRALPGDVRLDLELVEHRVFGNGTAFLHHRSR
ncbi:dihydrofolate reductase family protein [Pseudonocardia phyllosphaerae]|uniref:dihydrofolate reductase family protein n=1 Tax=Pseudonocardia phyllosphaerae TaxID=3390502 RepID=UPI00397D1A4D